MPNDNYTPVLFTDPVTNLQYVTNSLHQFSSTPPARVEVCNQCHHPKIIRVSLSTQVDMYWNHIVPLCTHSFCLGYDACKNKNSKFCVI